MEEKAWSVHGSGNALRRLFTSLWIRKERDQSLDSGLGYNVHRPVPTDSLLPAKPHHLLAPQPFQIKPPPGEQAFRIEASVGNFRFKSQQHLYKFSRDFMINGKNIYRTKQRGSILEQEI